MKTTLKVSSTAKVGLSIALGVSLIFGFIYYGLNFSPSAQAARQNVLNSEKIKVGMPKGEVLQIMGQPDRIEPLSKYVDPKHHGVWRHEGLQRYYYQPPALAGDGIYIWMDTTDTVVHITYFEL